MSSADQTFCTLSSQSQRGREGAGAQPTAQKQLQGAAHRGESLDRTFHLFTDLRRRARLSAFTGQGRRPLKWDIESGRATTTLRLRSESSWCRSSCCFQLSPHKSPVCWGKTGWLAAHRQEMIRPVAQHHLVGLALFKHGAVKCRHDLTQFSQV